MKNTRLIIAIISTILEEVAIALIVVWGLPKIGVNIPILVLVPVIAVWLFYSVYTYQKGTKVLKTENVPGMSSMIGTRGTVVSPLNPSGWVMIMGELWAATSTTDEIQPGKEVIVTGQKGLKLEVRDKIDSENIMTGQ
jgi:membrane-bound ClpP family serine protease